MPLYEHVMIARQDLSNTQAEGLIEHFGTVLSDNGGTARGQRVLGRQNDGLQDQQEPQGPLCLPAHRCAGTGRAGNGTPDAPA